MEEAILEVASAIGKLTIVVALMGATITIAIAEIWRRRR